MIIQLAGRTGKTRVSLSGFLASGRLRILAMSQGCSPEALLVEHLPEIYDTGDDDELAQAIGEACELVTDYAVNHVRAEKDDIAFFRQHLCCLAGWSLFSNSDPDPDPAMALAA